MTDTTNNGFNTVAQAGSGVVWSGLSNMPYPTEGEGTAVLPLSALTANTLHFKIPYETINIPTGAKLTYLDFRIKVRKNGLFASITDLIWRGSTNHSGGGAVWLFTQTETETYQSLAIGGDLSFWKITSLTETQAMDKITDGSLYFTIDVSNTGVAVATALAKTVTVILSYESVAGERAAVIAALV